jgi:cyclase
MIKTRVIPILLIQDGLLKKRIKFTDTRTIANPVTIARVFEARRTDELIVLDIGRTVDQEDIDQELVHQIAEELHMPFAYGGGIRTLKQITETIKSGAEKVVINTAAVENPQLIKDAAEKFGSQCIIVSIDAKKKGTSYETFIRSGTKSTGLDPVAHAKQAEKWGAGEILITSMDNEGTMQGYDLELLRKVADAISIPVIASGGIGKLDDFVAGVKDGHASAVAAGSIFHYTPITPNMAKERMKEAGIPVRIQNPEYVA